MRISPFDIQPRSMPAAESLAELLTHAPITVPLEAPQVRCVQVDLPQPAAPSQGVPEPLGLVMFAAGWGAVWGRRPSRRLRR
jgi:hypothetical protein